MLSTVVVVPCYNEEKRLPAAQFVDALRGLASVRFLFVDDGSTDQTRTVLDELARRNPSQIEVLALAHNMGKGEAVRRGLLAACAQGPAVVGFWDADLATPLTEIPRFIEILERNPSVQVLLGSRVKLLGREVERSPGRHLIGRAMATLIAVSLNLPVYDTQCGAKMFRVTPTLKSVLEHPFEARWVFDVELIARLRDAFHAAGVAVGEAMREEPLLEWCDVHGSKVKMSDGLIALGDIARIRMRRWT